MDDGDADSHVCQVRSEGKVKDVGHKCRVSAISTNQTQIHATITTNLQTVHNFRVRRNKRNRLVLVLGSSLKYI